jgi:hypothetical protein
MINRYRRIIARIGKSTSVEVAVDDLIHKLSTLEPEYETIGNLAIIIDRHNSEVHNSITVYAIQILGRKEF